LRGGKKRSIRSTGFKPIFSRTEKQRGQGKKGKKKTGDPKDFRGFKDFLHLRATEGKEGRGKNNKETKKKWGQKVKKGEDTRQRENTGCSEKPLFGVGEKVKTNWKKGGEK